MRVSGSDRKTHRAICPVTSLGSDQSPQNVGLDASQQTHRAAFLAGGVKRHSDGGVAVAVLQLQQLRFTATAAISSLYRWAAEPNRSAVIGVPHNTLPRRSLLHAEKMTLPLNEEKIGLLFAAIARAAHLDRNSKLDYVLIKDTYLLACRVSEIAVIRLKDIEALDDDGQIHLYGKGSKRRTLRVSAATLDLFQELGRGDAEAFVFPSPRG